MQPSNHLLTVKVMLILIVKVPLGMTRVVHNHSKRNKEEIDSRWLCLRSFLLDAEIVGFFFVDTTPFVLKYWIELRNNNYDWRKVCPREKYIDNLLKDLDAAVQEFGAPWKFVVGHHTMRSVSDHGDTEEHLEKLLPILKHTSIKDRNGRELILQITMSCSSSMMGRNSC